MTNEKAGQGRATYNGGSSKVTSWHGLRGTTFTLLASLLASSCHHDDNSSPSGTDDDDAHSGGVPNSGKSASSNAQSSGTTELPLGGTNATWTGTIVTNAGTFMGQGGTFASGPSTHGGMDVGSNTEATSAAGAPIASSSVGGASGGGTPGSGIGGAANGGATRAGAGGVGLGATTGALAGGTGLSTGHQGGAALGGASGMGGVSGSGTATGTRGPTDVCASDAECAAYSTRPYCVNGQCVACEAGNAAHACFGTFVCCGNTCSDVSTDSKNCGECGKSCELSQASSVCSGGLCTITQCQPGHLDCNLDYRDGCESAGATCGCVAGTTENCYTGPAGTSGVGLCRSGVHTCNASGTAWSGCANEVGPSPDTCDNNADDDCNGIVNDGYPNASGCKCIPGTTLPCYEGAAGTQGVGACRGGTKTCATRGTYYGYCADQVTPINEVCGNGIDDDCDGQIDEGVDLDGDGWTTCGGDCCDHDGPACTSPGLVNPGAIEVSGDGVDNDCNAQIDEDPYPSCSSNEDFSTGTGAAKALALLNAMEICRISTNGNWGILSGSAALSGADKTGTPNYAQVGIMHQFGSDASNLPRAGQTMASLSTGRARDNSDPDPTTSITYSYGKGNPPPDFVSAHGGSLPATGPGCDAGSGANDSVLLGVQLKAPTNAYSFSFNFRFFSQEYMQYTCSRYNDFFVALLDSTWVPGPGQMPIPADKNVSFDSNGNYVSVNSTQFFTVCKAKTGYTCPDGVTALAGTGWTDSNAGATAWLTTTVPVVPGETITLRFVIWDTSDQSLDSLVLLDNFRWSAKAASGPVTKP